MYCPTGPGQISTREIGRISRFEVPSDHGCRGLTRCRDCYCLPATQLRRSMPKPSDTDYVERTLSDRIHRRLSKGQLSVVSNDRASGKYFQLAKAVRSNVN